MSTAKKNIRPVHSEEALKAFKKAAISYTRKSTTSIKVARETLVREGILTKSGKLTKNYKS